MTGSSLILNVSGVDCDTALSLGSLIDVSVINKLSLALHSESLGDSSGKSSLTMVNVTNGTNVYMGLSSFRICFAIWNFLPFNWLNNCLMHQHKTILSILHLKIQVLFKNYLSLMTVSAMDFGTSA